MSGPQHILAVGDLHARHDLLSRVLRDLLPGQPPDTLLIFLGDYIDRGPEARQVVDGLLKLRDSRPQTVFLMGNHERMLLDALEGYRVPVFLHNGGYETLASYGLAPESMGQIPAAHLEFFRSLALHHETPDYIFVHAGLRPGVPLAEQEERDLIWIRDEFYDSRADFGKTVVFGHTPFASPLVRDNLIGIDTGAVYGNRLTCLELPEMKFHSFS